jgi:hypothetical protein
LVDESADESVWGRDDWRFIIAILLLAGIIYVLFVP